MSQARILSVIHFVLNISTRILGFCHLFSGSQLKSHISIFEALCIVFEYVAIVDFNIHLQQIDFRFLYPICSKQFGKSLFCFNLKRNVALVVKLKGQKWWASKVSKILCFSAEEEKKTSSFGFSGVLTWSENLWKLPRF